MSWLQQLRRAIEKATEENPKGFLAYTLASVDLQTLSPQARTCVHRGFVNEQKPDEASDKTNPALDKNGNPWTGAQLEFSTDVRSAKVAQIDGKPVQISWWFPNAALQFRLSGTAYIVRENVIPEALRYIGPEKSLSPNEEPFDWEKERFRHFLSTSASLRAGFANDAPGTERDSTKESIPRLPSTDLSDPVVRKALENFALVVVDVSSVDYVDLKAGTRVIYTGDNSTEVNP